MTKRFPTDRLRTSPLLVDEYSWVMPQLFWLDGEDPEVSFELFARSLPDDNGYWLTAGLTDALDHLGQLRFTEQELAWMATLPEDPQDPSGPPLFRPEFLNFLRDWHFSGQVYAIPEGTVVAPQTPILRVTAPVSQAFALEAYLLSAINRPTGVATKASRIAYAAQGRPVADNSARRDPGPETMVATARASYIGGFTSTATMGAGMRYGIPTYGTMAHAYMQMHGEGGEQAAFERWLRTYPGRATFLIDTFDAAKGIEHAIAASLATGVALKAIRLDSSNLAELWRYVRARLDEAGMTATKVIATDGLDEYKIDELLAAGANFDSFASGTEVGNPRPVNVVYKIVEQEHTDDQLRFLIKKAVGKGTDPGRHQVHRTPAGDVLSLSDEMVGGRPLMERVMAGGALVKDLPDLHAIREHAQAELERLPAEVRALRDPQPLRLARTRKLVDLRAQLGDQTADQLLVAGESDNAAEEVGA